VKLAREKPTQNDDDDFRLMVQKIASCQTIWTQIWHGVGAENPSEPFFVLIQEEHRRNFFLWHEEDKARAPDATAAQIAKVKRNIDRVNKERNDLIEKLDEHIYKALQTAKVKAKPESPWNTETPGSVIDRLSILSLKVFHMREQSERLDATPEHIQKARDRLKILTLQHGDLTTALQCLLDDLFAGRKQMKIYRQFKMYNDPDTNPEIYKKQK